MSDIQNISSLIYILSSSHFSVIIVIHRIFALLTPANPCRYIQSRRSINRPPSTAVEHSAAAPAITRAAPPRNSVAETVGTTQTFHPLHPDLPAVFLFYFRSHLLQGGKQLWNRFSKMVSFSTLSPSATAQTVRQQGLHIRGKSRRRLCFHITDSFRAIFHLDIKPFFVFLYQGSHPVRLPVRMLPSVPPVHRTKVLRHPPPCRRTDRSPPQSGLLEHGNGIRSASLFHEYGCPQSRRPLCRLRRHLKNRKDRQSPVSLAAPCKTVSPSAQAAA